jgi:hypothetical protein
VFIESGLKPATSENLPPWASSICKLYETIILFCALNAETNGIIIDKAFYDCVKSTGANVGERGGPAFSTRIKFESKNPSRLNTLTLNLNQRPSVEGEKLLAVTFLKTGLSRIEASLTELISMSTVESFELSLKTA